MLDARTLTYRAHAYFPDGVDAPVGFHGMWVSHPPMFWFVWTNCVNVTKSEPALPASRRTVYPTRINFNWSNFKQYQHSASKHWMWHLLFWVESSSLMQKAVCSFMFWHTVLGTHKSLTTRWFNWCLDTYFTTQNSQFSKPVRGSMDAVLGWTWSSMQELYSNSVLMWH